MSWYDGIGHLPALLTSVEIVPDGTARVTVEWAQEVRMADSGTPWESIDLNHLFRKTLLGKAELALGDFSALHIQGAYDLERDDWYLQVEPVWSVRDGFEVRLLVDLLGGPEGSFFRSFREKRRTQLRARLTY